MADALRKARQLADQVRFAEDQPFFGDRDTVSHNEHIRSFFRQSGLRISPEVTPGLWKALEAVCQNLWIPLEAVEAFVSASPELQAQCFSGGSDVCIIRFTSGIVDLLSLQEFAFVLGHELGHFLLAHGTGSDASHSRSLEHFIQQRCQEISSDRIGLLGCQSLDASLRAMMKMTSGLGHQHLRFDVGRFVSQLQGQSEDQWLFNETGTHPSILVRCRALLWFSLSQNLQGEEGLVDHESMASLDRRIIRDLHRYVDGPARQRIAEAEGDVLLWLAAAQMMEPPGLSAHQNAALANALGKETIAKLRAYVASLPSATASEVLNRKLEEAESQLHALIPTSFEANRSAIQRKLESLLAIRR